MRKIKISEDLYREAHEFSRNLFTERGPKFVLPKTKLTALIKDIKHKNLAYQKYVQRILDNYEEINCADPVKMLDLIEGFKKDFPNVDLSKNIPYKKLKFHEAIVIAMRYDALREKEFITYLTLKAIKVCVYCNANSTIVVDSPRYRTNHSKKLIVRKARFELDHYYPKSKYPFLCTSFFNLYPVCGNCNRSKGASVALFQLYTKEDNLDVFKFWLDDLSLVKYWSDKRPNASKLKVRVETIDGDLAMLRNHDELFQVQGIADCHSDIVEELVIKAMIYTDSYKKRLVASFSEVLPDEALINRLLVGNYTNPDDVHKRPLAKLTQDIARQLGLIS